jgi:hypothetical protein
MEILRHIWDAAPFWAPVGILTVVALIIVGLARSRTRKRTGPFPLETEADLLDSSHIGFAPLGSSKQRLDPLTRVIESFRRRDAKRG